MYAINNNNDAAISKPDFGAGSLSSYTLTGHPKASTKFKASKRSRNYYEKSLEHSGNIVSEYHRDKNVGRTTAEQDVSSSVFFRSKGSHIPLYLLYNVSGTKG